MLSPSPTQQQSAPEPKRPGVPSARRRPGQSRAGLLLKTVLRPIIKLLYYILRAISSHKLVTALLLLVLIVSSSIATYVATGQLPFGIGYDQFNFHIRGGDGGGEHVKNWLYDLRDGEVAAMSLIQSELMHSPAPDPQQLVDQFSQKKTNLTWKSITVMGVYTESDTTVDSFVEVDLAGSGPGGAVNGLMIWHFTTVPQLQGRMIFIHLVTFRKPLL